MDIEQRLQNWARYYRDRLQRQVCGSIEGKLYHAPWRQWVELSSIPSTTVIDWRDAELVEAAWKKMLGRSKLVLKYSYMANFPVYIVCRKSGIKAWQLEAELARAKQVIHSLLAQSEGMVYNNTNLSRESEMNSPLEAVSSRAKETEAIDS